MFICKEHSTCIYVYLCVNFRHEDVAWWQLGIMLISLIYMMTPPTILALHLHSHDSWGDIFENLRKWWLIVCPIWFTYYITYNMETVPFTHTFVIAYFKINKNNTFGDDKGIKHDYCLTGQATMSHCQLSKFWWWFIN